MGISLAARLVALCPLLPALPQSRPVDPGELDELLLRYTASGWSGAALVARGGEVVLAKGYGFADFDAERLNTERTLFELASITKSFTGAAVVKLAEQEKLALDDSIAVHLPGVPAHSRKITVLQLLSHTSGIPRANARGRGDDLAKAVVDYLGDGPQGKPGARWEYWNGGYALLAGIVEQASGRPYTSYLEEELFAPAGMRDTGFTGDADLDAGRAAIGSSKEGRPRSALEHPYGDYGYQYRGMGGIVTSVLDLLAWDRALAAGKLLSAESLSRLFEPVAEGYACGWYVGRAIDGSVRQSHGGAVRGFTSEFRRLPERDACIAVLSNTDDARPWEIAENLECLLLGRAPKTPPPREEPLPWEEARALAGSFAGEAGRLVVRAAPGVVMAGVEGQELLEALGARGKLDWKADFAASGARAVEIVGAIARGNSEPLRSAMAPRIPERWPDDVRRTIWPAHEQEHGRLKGVRPLAALARGGRVEVLLALEHAQSPSRALVAFGPAGLELLDWHGPQFPLVLRLSPLGHDAFTAEVAGERVRLEFEREGATAAKVRVAGSKLARE